MGSDVQRDREKWKGCNVLLTAEMLLVKLLSRLSVEVLDCVRRDDGANMAPVSPPSLVHQWALREFDNWCVDPIVGFCSHIGGFAKDRAFHT